MARLLCRVVAAESNGQTGAGGVPLDYLGTLLRAFEEDGQLKAHRGIHRVGPGTTVVPGLIEALSDVSWRSCGCWRQASRIGRSPTSCT